MKITNFVQLESAQHRAHEAKIAHAQAQTEAARELLAKSRAHGTDPTFWQNALDFAEANEAQARKNFARWQRRDRNQARNAFEFSRALLGATTKHLKELEAA